MADLRLVRREGVGAGANGVRFPSRKGLHRPRQSVILDWVTGVIPSDRRRDERQHEIGVVSGGIEEGPEGCESDTKAAGLATLIEVLTADDDDNDLSNGTPNRTAICTIFAGRLIESPPGLGLCTESAGGWACTPDINRDGVLDFFDFVELLNWTAAGDPRADLNGDGAADLSDFILFDRLFREGC